MDINNAISPLDGQYRSKINDVIKIFVKVFQGGKIFYINTISFTS